MKKFSKMSCNPGVSVEIAGGVVIKSYPFVDNEIGMCVPAYLEYRFFGYLNRLLRLDRGLEPPKALLRPINIRAGNVRTVFVFRRVGCSLAQCLENWALFPHWDEPIAPRIAREVLKVLIFMRDHMGGAFHNDIKEENIVLDDNEVCLIDYGAATVPRHEVVDREYTVYYANYDTLGTDACKSPERLSRRIDHPTEMTELWSLGQAIRRVPGADLIRAQITRMTDPNPDNRGGYNDYMDI